MTGTASEGPPPRTYPIVYLLVGLELGGTERQITDVLALDRTRFETRVCCLSTGGPTIGPCATCGGGRFRTARLAEAGASLEQAPNVILPVPEARRSPEGVVARPRQ